MKPHKVTTKKLSGTSYSEVERAARKLHNQISARTKRNPYIRSAYFHKDKVFINSFWQHLSQKPRRDRKRRLKYYPCAIELLRNGRAAPVSKLNPNKSSETLYRFAGLTVDNELFYVQVREARRSRNKYFVSVFPPH